MADLYLSFPQDKDFHKVLCSIYKDGAASLYGICEFGPVKEGV